MGVGPHRRPARRALFVRATEGEPPCEPGIEESLCRGSDDSSSFAEKKRGWNTDGDPGSAVWRYY